MKKTATQTFIEKAIEGGWHPQVDEYYVLPIDTAFPFRELNVSSILLDPLAWQAVGKVEGWLPKGYRVGGMITQKEMWLHNMRRMIDALADGKTIEEYLTTLFV